MILDEKERKLLASKLNALIDLPLLSEEREQDLAELLIDKCLGLLEKNTPSQNEMRSLSRSTSKGTMKNMVTNKLVKALNTAINVPYVSEKNEEKVFTMIVCFIMKHTFDKVVLPDSTEDAAANGDGDTTPPVPVLIQERSEMDIKQELASKLNDVVDIPLVSDAKEQQMAEKLIEICLGPLLENVPSDDEMVAMIRSSNRDVMENMVTNKLVKAVNEAIDVPFVDEVQEESVLTLIVCSLMENRYNKVAWMAAIQDRQAQQERVEQTKGNVSNVFQMILLLLIYCILRPASSGESVISTLIIN